MNAPRPKVTKEMIMEAAEYIISEMDGGNAETLAEHYTYPMDGFEIALQLSKWAGWDITREEIETLDDMDSEIRDKLRAAEKEWFEENNIQPPLPIGSVIKLNSLLYDGVSKGEITGITEYNIACYEVKPAGQDDEKTGRRRAIIKFEDAVPVANVGIDSEGGAHD